MWVYQGTESDPDLSAPLLPAVPEPLTTPEPQETNSISAAIPSEELPLAQSAAAASRRAVFAPDQGTFLLAVSYLLGTFTAGVVQALLDAEELDMLAYYLNCWRELFSVQSAAQIAGLFGAELATVLGALCVLLLLGLSAIGPLPIYLFAMLYGAGTGLISAQLFSGVPISQAVLLEALSGIPTALAAGVLCLFGSCALQVSGRLHAFSFGRGKEAASAHAQLLFGQFALATAAMLPLCGAAVCLAYLGSQLG